MPTIPNNAPINEQAPAQDAEQKKAQAIKNLDSRIKTGKASEDRLYRYIGPEAKPDANYSVGEALKTTDYPIKDEDKDWISAIICGAILDKDNLAICGMGRIHSEDYMVMNVLSKAVGGRDYGFENALLHGRQNAVKALLQKDETALARYAYNFMNYMEHEGNDHSIVGHGSETGTFCAMYRLYEKVKNSPYFKDIRIAEKADRKIAEKVKTANLADEALNQSKELIEKMPAANSEERKAMVLDIMTKFAMSHLSESFYVKEVEAAENSKIEGEFATPQYYQQVVAPTLKKKYADNLFKLDVNMMQPVWASAVYAEKHEITHSAQTSSVTYQTEVLADPEKTAAYTAKLQELLKTSQTYKTLVESNDVEEIGSILGDLDSSIQYFKFENGSGIPTENLYVNDADRKEDEERAVLIGEQIKSSLDGSVKNMASRFNEEIQNLISFYDKSHYDTEKKELYTSFMQAVRAAGIRTLDMKHIYNRAGHDTQCLNDQDAQTSIKNNLYVEHGVILKDEAGAFYRFAVNKSGKVVASKAKFVPIQDIYGGSYAYKINHDIAKSNSKPVSTEDSRIATNLQAYVDVATHALGNVQIPNAMRQFYSAAGELSQAFQQCYETETYQVQGQSYKHYVRNIDQAGIDRLKAACQACIEAGKAYQLEIPLDSMVSDMVSMVQADLEVLQKINLKDGAMPLAVAYADAAKDEVTKQNHRLDAAKAPQPGVSRTSTSTEIVKNAVDDYILKRAAVAVYPDGVVRRENECYFNEAGAKLDQFQIGDFIRDHAADVKQYALANYTERQQYEDVNYNAEKLIEICRKLNPNYIVPTQEEQLARSRDAIEYDRKFYEARVNQEIEAAIANGRQPVDRKINAFYRTDGSEESRAWNRNLATLATSSDPADVTRAYELCLEEVSKVNLDEFNVMDDTLALKEPDKLMRFAGMAQELKDFVKDAQDKGVDIGSEVYDGLRNKLPSICAIGNLCFDRWSYLMHPASALLDLKQLENCDYEAFQGLVAEYRNEMAENDIAPNAESDLLDKLGLVMNDNMLADHKLNDSTRGKSMTEIAANANSFITPPALSMDEDIVALRRELEHNVRYTRSGEIIANSPLYDQVGNAIDAYLTASIKDKEAKRAAIVTACDSYIGERNANRERTKLMVRIRDYAASDEFKRQTEELGYERTAREMVARYQHSLEEQMQGLGFRERSDLEMVEYLKDTSYRNHLIAALVKTDECKRINRAGWNMADYDLLKAPFKRLERSISFLVNKKLDVLDEALKVYKEQNHVRWNEDKAYDQNGLKVDSEFIPETLMRNREIYIKNREGGFAHLRMEINGDGFFQLNCENVSAIPFQRSEDAVNQNHMIYEANLSSAREDIGAQDRFTIANVKRLSDFCKTFTTALAAFHDQIPHDLAALVDAADSLQGMLEKHSTKVEQHIDNMQTMAYPEMSADEYQALLQAYENVNLYATRLQKSNPGNVYAKELISCYQKDVAFLKQLPLQNGGMSLETAIEHYTDKTLEKQNDDFYALDKVSESARLATVMASQTDKLMMRFLRERAGLDKTPDGVYRKFDSEFLKNGRIFDMAAQAEAAENIPVQEINACIDRYAKEHLYRFDRLQDENAEQEFEHAGIPKNLGHSMEHKEELYNQIENAMKQIFPGYVKPSQAIMQERVQMQAQIQEKLFKVQARRVMEEVISGASVSNIPRCMYNFIDLSQTPQARQANKDLVRRLGSKNPEEKKEAYKECLRKLNAIDLQELDLGTVKGENTDSLLHNFLSERYPQMKQLFDIQTTLEGAVQAGVDLNDPEFESLRLKAPAMEDLGMILQNKLDVLLCDAYPYIGDTSNLDQADKERADNLVSEHVKDGDKDMMNALEPVQTYSQYAPSYRYYQFRKNHEQSIEECIESTFDNRKNMATYGEDEKDFYELYQELKENKRYGMFGRKIDNSDYYDEVVTAMQEFRKAKAVDKEAKRQQIVEKCQAYLNRNFIDRNNSRGRLITRIQEYVEGPLKPIVGKLEANYKDRCAERLMKDCLAELQEANKHQGAAFEHVNEESLKKHLRNTNLFKAVVKDFEKYYPDGQHLNVTASMALHQVEEFVVKEQEKAQQKEQQKEHPVQPDPNAGPQNNV